MTKSLLLLALAGALVAAAAHAQSLPPPPSMNDPGPGAGQAPKKPAPKGRRPAKPAEAGTEAAAKPAAKAAPQRSSAETRPMPRRIDPSDIDDPYGGVGPRERSAPTFTPSGKIGVGGRF